MSTLVPNYYSVQDTPAGPRWVYPLPNSVYAPAMHDVTSPGGAVEIHKGYAVADHHLGEVTYYGSSSRVLNDATIKDDSYVTPKFPAIISAKEWNDRCECGGEDDCTWCRVRYDLYTPRYVDRPGERRTLDFSEYVFLADGMDAHPEYAWSTSMHQSVLFSDGFHHLRPGTLPHVRTLLQDVLKQLPNVTNVYDQKDFSVYVTMSWSEPKTEHRPRKDSRNRTLKGMQTRTVATIEKRYEIPVPYAIAGETKAEAVQKWFALRDKWVAFFTEANVTACSHCDGYGYVAPTVPR